MSIPVQLSDLDFENALDTDLTLIRRGPTDYRTLVSSMRSINAAGLPALADPAQATDLMVIQQSGTLSQIPFGQVGFVKGTQMWFYQSAAPAYWTIIAGTGDTLLAVAGGSTYSTGGTSAGDWLQRDVDGVSGKGLSINQMPAHTHGIVASFQDSGTDRVGSLSGSTVNFQTESTGSAGGTGETSLAHNHGSNWRPSARIGILCQKSF